MQAYQRHLELLKDKKRDLHVACRDQELHIQNLIDNEVNYNSITKAEVELILIQAQIESCDNLIIRLTATNKTQIQ